MFLLLRVVDEITLNNVAAYCYHLKVIAASEIKVVG